MDIEQIKLEPSIIVKEELQIELKNEEKPLLVEEFTYEENEPSTSENVEEEVYEFVEHVCCCCGNKRKSEGMTQMPKSEKEFQKWSRCLSKKFHENPTLSSESWVCRSHFTDKYGDSRLIDVIRGKKTVLTKFGEKIKCCYCGRSRMGKAVTVVPIDSINFPKWVKILGKTFYEHFQTRGSICRDHFKMDWYGNRPRELLPVADFEGEYVEEDWEDDMIKTPEITKVKHLLPELEGTCIYCGDTKFHTDLTKVTPNPDKLEIWGRRLGEEFYKRALASEKNPTFICRSHFEFQWEKKRPVNFLPRADADPVLSKEIKQREDQNLDLGLSAVKRIKLEVKEESNFS